MFETLAVFQLARFWLKADAELNICARQRRMAPKSAGQAHGAGTRKGARGMSHSSKHTHPRQATEAAAEPHTAKRSTSRSRD